MPSTSKRVVIYVRVSRDDTGEGAAIGRQLDDCTKLAELRGWTVVEVCQDNSISAMGRKKRPGWQRVLELVDAGAVDVVLAWHVDRMTRSMVDLEHLIQLTEKHGVGIATVNGDIDLSNDTGRLLARILGAVARGEVERKGARQRRANQQRAAEGLPWRSGWRAFGYTHDGKVIEKEAKHVRKAVDDVLDGVPIKAVMRRWNELGIHGDRSQPGGWTHRGIVSVVSNPRYAGLVRYKGKVVGRGNWRPIISEEKHTLITAMLSDPQRYTRPGRPSQGRRPENLLSGIATCATCQQTVAAGNRAGKAVYRCKGDHVVTPREAADAWVTACVVNALMLTTPGTIIPLENTDDRRDLTAEASELRDRLNTLSNSYASGGITIEQLESASSSIRVQLADIEERAAEHVRERGYEAARAMRDRQMEDFEELPLNGKREVLKAISTITLHPRGRGRRNVGIRDQVEVRLRTRTGRTFLAS